MGSDQDPVHPDHFWVNPFGVAWPLLKASDLILVNPQGQVVEGGPVRLLNAAGSTPLPLYPSTSADMQVSIYDPSRSTHSQT